jgi:hypothetical protein
MAHITLQFALHSGEGERGALQSSKNFTLQIQSNFSNITLKNELNTTQTSVEKVMSHIGLQACFNKKWYV